MYQFVMVSLMALTFSISAKAFNDSPATDQEYKQELQMDNMFEVNQNAQLKLDKEYAANDIKQSEVELGAEKSRVNDLKAQNESLTKEIKKNVKIAKDNRKIARRESKKAQRLERIVSINEKRLTKLKIANVNLKKSIELAQKKQVRAEAKLKRAQAQAKIQAEDRKNLKIKKSKIVKARRPHGKVKMAIR